MAVGSGATLAAKTESPSRGIGAVVVVWNGWAMTLKCLRALRASRGAPLGIVVVDNGSEEGMPREVASLADHVIRCEENRGFGPANNLGISWALSGGCDYIWLINNDAFPEPGALAAMVEVAEANPCVGAVGAVLQNEDGSLQSYGGGRVVRWAGFTREARGSGDAIDYLTAACVLLRAEAVRKVGGFHERFFMYWEDVDLGARLRQAGWELAVAEGARVVHLGGGSAGKLSPQVARWSAESCAIYAMRHLRLPRAVATVALALRVAGLWRRGKWQSSRAAVAGWRAGLRKGRK